MSSVADMIAELDDHGFEDTTSTRKVAVINDSLFDVCSREPWPFLEKRIQLQYDGSSAVATNYPTDFKQSLMLTNPDTGQTIAWERADTLRKRFANSFTAVAMPFTYYLEAGVLKPFPIPISGTKLDLAYIAVHSTLTDVSLEADILLPPRHHRVLVIGALYKLYAMEDDPELSAVFQQDYEHRITTMREELMRLQYDRADHIFMVDPEDYDTYAI